VSADVYVHRQTEPAIGAPGSGKGTLCCLLAQDYDFYHLSVGDYMRGECLDPDSCDGEVIKDHLQRGELVPTEVILPMLRKKIEDERKKGYERFLIDGFPREVKQGVEFETMVTTAHASSMQAAK
jgi:adenylate kinase family enzyme